MTKNLITSLVLLIFLLTKALAQSHEVSGRVVSASSGEPLPGVSVVVKGSRTGTSTDAGGFYTIRLADGHHTLVFSFLSKQTLEVAIAGRQVIDVSMEPDAMMMDPFVVTALGISRERKSLGYATQQVDHDALWQSGRDNLIQALSGRVAGVVIRSTNNFGGSNNVVIRGHSSLTQNNQALFIVDGVPFNNDNTNHPSQQAGRYGFDFGNAASDINTYDIESVHVLKGAAATALYGSRAANGVVIINTTRPDQRHPVEKGLGVSIHSHISTGMIDWSSFPVYQQQYGAGYGPYYGDPPYAGFERVWDVNGDGLADLTVPTSEDASMGQRFDPQILVYQWDAFDPASPNYMTKTPWVAATNGPASFFETPLMLMNNISLTNRGDNSFVRLAYTNSDQKGVMPNSHIRRNNVLINTAIEPWQSLSVRASANFIHTAGTGRTMTGYSENTLTSFRQWMQTNVDYKMQKQLYEKTGENITWNRKSPFDPTPAYWNNPYFQHYENFPTDERNRITGFAEAEWHIRPGLNLLGRAGIDTYRELQEERRAIGSVSEDFGVGRPKVTSGYSRFEKSFTETNLDLLLRYHATINEAFSIMSLVGTNIRRSVVDRVYASTDGGLILPGIYALSNSVNPIRNPEERYAVIGVNGLYMNASLGYRGFLFLETTVRRDQSSTLPGEHNAYIYPSVSGSWIFSEHTPARWLQLGKVRAGYAMVGNDAPWGSIRDTYIQYPSFAGLALFAMPQVKNNSNLKPEHTTSLEAGLEMIGFNRRLGLDLAVYRNNTVNQIMPLAVSSATGYLSKFVNGGEIQNQGIEVMLLGIPVRTTTFGWDLFLNWSANRNEVVSLASDIENLQLASFQGGVTINARVGEPYGTIQGTDYVYTNGQKTVGANGYYLRTATSDIVLGHINPDWNAGISNKFSYRNWSASFLVDWQQGGSVYSLDMHYGLGTGIYPETVFTNDLGNPVRLPVADGGGLILEGVYADGSPNTTRVEGGNHRVFGWVTNPNRAFVYDASFIKLREVVLSWTATDRVLARMPWVQRASINLTANNVWIIHKNLPYSDPEASQSSGNIQGWQCGVMPSVRQIGLGIQVSF